MTLASMRERHALDVLEPVWRNKGYTLFREPSPQQLPDFLKGMRPDAIATGAAPSLVIEIAAGQGPAKESYLRRLKSALDGQDDWRLEVVYVGSEGSPIKPASLDVIQSTLGQIGPIAQSQPEAALLLGWAALEALGRVLEPQLAEYSLGARALVDVLVGYGYLSQEDGAKLRALAAKRNSIAHGELEAPLPEEDITSLVALAETLLKAARSTQPPGH